MIAPVNARVRQRAALAVALCMAIGAVAVVWGGVSWASPGAAPQITLSALPLQVSEPVHVTHAGDGSGRLFVVERSGRIRIFVSNTLVLTPFLDIAARVRDNYVEEGLLSVAFPPDFAGKQRFYVYYVDNNGDLQISRFGMSTNPEVADAASEVKVLWISHPVEQNHNGGQLHFGLDGFLYAGTGDGGSGGDPPNNAQNGFSLLGKLLRIDVESSYPAVPPYTIPPSNPFTQTGGIRNEIWALGLRNPWRFSFDRIGGDLFLGDVGQGNLEEVDYQSSASAGGENYGWSCYEGRQVYDAGRCSGNISYTFPITQYANFGAQECSVIGGFVYRGLKYGSMAGHYFYADHCSGKIWSLERSGSLWLRTLLHDAPFEISSFGEDENGELYVAAMYQGKVYHLGAIEPAVFLPIAVR